MPIALQKGEFAVFVIAGFIGLAVALFVALLPGIIARRRGHPSATAISICGLLGAFFFPAWIVAIVWAYTGPAAPHESKPSDYHLGTSQPLRPTETTKSDIPRMLSRRERGRH